MNSALIPHSIMRLPGFAAKQDNREIIIDYLVSQQGSVQLTEKQEELLRRWHAADDLMRSLRYTSKEVAKTLVEKFNIAGQSYSSATAWRDMDDARYVFGTTRKPNKPYLLALHIERIESAIVVAQRTGKPELLPKLMECYTNALKHLPEGKDKERNPSAIIFNITQNNYGDIAGVQMTPQQASDAAAKRLTEWGIALEDVMHEEVEDE